MSGRHIIIMMLAGSAAWCADDLSGWSGARWGMSEQAVLDAFPGRAVRNDVPDACPVVIRTVPIGSTDYRACFYFSSGKLARVDLSPVRRADITESEFGRSESLLAEKYGKPWQRRERDVSESRWSFRSSRISLSLDTIRGTPIVLTLRYEHIDPANKPEID